MADLVVTEGYAAVGYEYINVDDCWLEKTRGPHGELVADRKRFPRGMKSLSDYVILIKFLNIYRKNEIKIKKNLCTCIGSCKRIKIWNI